MSNGLVPGPANGLGSRTDIDDGTLPRIGTPPPGSVGLDAKGGAQKPPAPSLADRVLAFARSKRGQVHGDGECFTLVDDALRSAGAKSAADFGQVAPDVDYIWGVPVARTALQVGDIIQMRDYHCDIESTTSNPDGSGATDTQVEQRPHHTAIVEEIGTDGRVTVLEQNVPDGGPVTRNVLHLTSTTYTSGAATVHVTVTGTFWFYRPQAR
jgi:hypothetical protein